MYKPLNCTQLTLSVFYFWLWLMWAGAESTLGKMFYPRTISKLSGESSQVGWHIDKIIGEHLLIKMWQCGNNGMDLESHDMKTESWNLFKKNNIKEGTCWIKANKQGCVLPALCESFIQHCFGVTRLHGMKATERTKNAKFPRNMCKYRIFFSCSFLSIASCDLQTPN